MSHPMAPPAGGYDPKVTPMSIATISSGFEKGDFLVREEKGQRVVSQLPRFYRVSWFQSCLDIVIVVLTHIFLAFSFYFQYFDFFEEAFNYIAYKGYIRMSKEDEMEWMDTMNNVHASVKGGMKYNTGKLLMVLYRPIPEAQS